MRDISEYTDYRAFLLDYYKEAKARNPVFSFQLFSARAGLASKGFLHNVIKGKRGLAKSAIFGLSQAMKLTKYEMDYFENLVFFNQAKSLAERNHYFEKLSSIKAHGKSARQPQVVRKDQFEFYSKLYHGVIRSLIGLYGFKHDFESLAKALWPRISTKQARRSVELLESLGFIKKDGDGSYSIVDKTITTPPEVASLAVQNFHREAGDLALRALVELPCDRRNMTGLTLGISRETYRRICEEISVFRARLLQIAEADEHADAVYQLNFQFFPVSKTIGER